MWKRRREAACFQLIEFIEALASALRAGRSVRAALAQLPPNTNGRFRSQLLELQQTSPTSMRRFRASCVAREEFATLVVALEASRQSHFELAPVLMSLSRAMRARHPGSADMSTR